MPEIHNENGRQEVIPRDTAIKRITAKGLRRRGDIRSFFERTAHPNSTIEAAAALDHSMRMGMASLGLAVADWAGHLLASPGTFSRLTTQGSLAWGQAMHQAITCHGVPSADPRYADKARHSWPFCALVSTHGVAETW